MDKFQKRLCCLDLTVATRLIGFVGVTLSILLMTILVNDKVGNNFRTSRTFALALGLDWQHFHVNANATHDADPRGIFISTIVIFYSILYLVTSMMLIYASISFNRWFAVPWLFCELIGCASKSVGLVYHVMDNNNQISHLFMIGSICYIVILLWWWIVVLVAQTTWKTPYQFTFHFTPTPKPTGLNVCTGDETNIVRYIRAPLKQQVSTLESPQPYEPNLRYCEI